MLYECESSRASEVTPAMSSSADRETKQVLVVFGDRRRPVTFTCSSNGKSSQDCAKEEYEWLVRAVESTFEDVLNAEEGSSTSSTGSFYLQIESLEWGGMIDVTPCTVVPDHEVVFLYRHESCGAGGVGSLGDSEKRGEKVCV